VAIRPQITASQRRIPPEGGQVKQEGRGGETPRRSPKGQQLGRGGHPMASSSADGKRKGRHPERVPAGRPGRAMARIRLVSIHSPAKAGNRRTTRRRNEPAGKSLHSTKERSPGRAARSAAPAHPSAVVHSEKNHQAAETLGLAAPRFDVQGWQRRPIGGWPERKRAPRQGRPSRPPPRLRHPPGTCKAGSPVTRETALGAEAPYRRSRRKRKPLQGSAT
jgi:hypothetical protein